MTPRRKAFIALLAIGAAALAADRLVPESENSAAETNPDLVVAQAPGGAKAASLASAAPTALSLSQRIRGAVEQATPDPSSRDIFRVPLAWIGPQKSGAEIGAPVVLMRRFDETHRLNGLILAGDRTGALIDGMLIKVGQSIDGYRLVSVANNIAVFESANERAVLRVEKSTFASGN